MVDMPAVSVVVRTKDRPELLRLAIGSVLSQTYRPIELVVVNDGGKDVDHLLTAIISDTQDIYLNYISHAHSLGRSQAANAGFLAASSPFCLFLDDDDYLDKDHIVGLVDAHQKHFSADELGVVHCRARTVSTNDKGEQKILSFQGQPLVKYQLFYHNVMPILTVLIPTNVRKLGVRFDNTIDLFEDWDFWLQVAQFCSFVFVDQTTCNYLIHTESSGVREREKQHLAYQTIYQKWLTKLTPSMLHDMLASTHLWHDQYIESLQANNAAELSRIGDLHSFALDTIAQKDRDIEHLTHLYKTVEHELITLRHTQKSAHESLEGIKKRSLMYRLNRLYHGLFK
ncbi:glycosyltransferase family 2 protein [Marinomonas gallaica]|uniref:glycosyltransferase family 2 protein n=1 Tax=Marinomonas gallaica TaxID=1806667 RepID=UPI0008307CAF|nr:glycosyltransferase [Marinomonas gallaica]